MGDGGDYAALVDEPRAVRAGEEIDAQALDAFLAQALPELTGALTVAQFLRGFSNLTYLVVKGGREMVLRRPPRGAAIKSAHDMGREHRILSALAPVYPKVKPAPASISQVIPIYT